MKKIALFSTICFLLLLCWGFAALLWQFAHNDGPFFSDLLTRENLVDGAVTADIDTHVNTDMRTIVRGTSWIDGFLYWSLKDAGSQVRVGDRGWLFLSEELLEVPEGNTFLRQRVRLAQKIAADCARRSVELVVLPVPDKALLVRDRRGGLAVAKQARQRLVHWQRWSAPLGLRVVDLRDGWPRPGFWRTDTHWDQIGAKFAALRTATLAKTLLHPATATPIRLDVAPEAHSRPGDLMRLADLVATSALFGPKPDEERTVKARLSTSGDLLDAPPAPEVLLAGSSYSLNSGFVDFLQVALSRQVVQKSHEGSGFAGSLLGVLHDNPRMLDHIKVIIWEWPVRSVTQPLSEAEKRYLSEEEAQ